MTLIRKDPKEELTENICDNICKHPVSDITQDELDEKVKQDFIKKFKGRQFIDGSKTD